MNVPPGAERFRDYWFDEVEARYAVDFFAEHLRHSKGEHAGTPFVLEEWQRKIVGDLFGWRSAVTGCRRYSTGWIEVPRKNGKSTLAAGLGLKLLTADGESGAEVYSAAADRDQASIVFREASEMVRQAPALSEMVEIQTKALIVADTTSAYRVLSADAHTKHGLNPSGIIFDEVHAQPNRDLWDVLTTGTGARRQPMTLGLTTAGHDRNSLAYQMHEYSLKVRDGVIDDPNFYVAIFAADPGDDWKDPATWRKANPNLGVSISEDYLARECRRAQELPGYENTFKRLHLNLWTEQETRWIALDSWDACDLEVAPPAELRGRTCVVGLDLSQTTDITACVLTFNRPDGTIDVVPRFYIPKENAEKRARRDRVPYPAWIAQGWIKATEGNVVDYDVLKEDVLALSKLYDVREVAYDPWNATQIALQLEAEGVSVIPVRQGFASMTAPAKHLEGLVLSKKIRHGGNPVLRWMISNAAIEIDAAGNIKPSKKKSTERIDGVVALINALSRATLPGSTGSIYQRRGLASI